MLAMHTISPGKKSARRRKRLGRGNASGSGTYSGRGQKGQRSRSGVSGLKRRGLRQTLQRIPKKRGFKSARPKAQPVNLSALSGVFRDGEMVSPAALFSKKIIKDKSAPVKILGQGELEASGLRFENVAVSASALEKIRGKGGKISAAENKRPLKA